MSGQIYAKKESADLLAEARHMRGRIDEILDKEAQEQGKASILGVMLSLAGYLIMGYVLYLALVNLFIRTGGAAAIAKIPFAGYFTAYTLVIGLLMLLGVYFTPKEEYYLGREIWGQTTDDPLTLKDNRDRAHAELGILLVIPNFIRINFLHFYQYVTSQKMVRNSTLAALLLLLAEVPIPQTQLIDELHSLGFGRSAVNRTGDYLQKAHWLELDRHPADPEIRALLLTEKGRQILQDIRQYLG